MLIVYKGAGLLSPGILIGLMVLSTYIAFPQWLIFILAGIISYVLGMKFHKSRHTFFWLSFGKLGVIYAILGIVILVGGLF